MHLSKVSDSLQSRSMSMDSAFDLIRAVESKIKEMRNEQQCNSFAEAASEMCSGHDIVGIDTSVPAKRKRPMPEKLKEFVLTENATGKEKESDHENQPEIKHNVRTGIYFPVIDRALTELNKRFSSANLSVLSGISALSPTSEHFLDFETLAPFAEHYNANVELLKIELLQLKSVITRKNDANQFHASNVLDMLAFVQKYEDAFFELTRLLKIASAIPVSSAEAERTFSKMRLVKSHLRTTMTTERLSDIILLASHKCRAKDINLDKVVDQFASLYPNCRIMLA